MTVDRHAKAPSALLLTAASLALGMQLVRAGAPSFNYVLYSRFGVPPTLALLAALALFSTGLAASALARSLGSRRTLGLTAAGVGLARLALQCWTGDAAVGALLAASGIACFLLMLPALAAAAREHLALGLALGCAVDVAIDGAFLGYDAAWQPGAMPLAIVCGLVAVQFVALRATLARMDDGGATAFPWGAFGCVLFLELAVFENAGRAAVASGETFARSLVWIAAGQAAGVLVAAWGLRGRRVASALLILALVPWSGVLALVALAVGPGALAMLVAGMGSARSGTLASGRSCAAAGWALAALCGALYLPMGVRVGFTAAWVPVGAGAVVAAFAWGARAESVGYSRAVRILAPAVAAATLLVAVGVWATWPEARVEAGTGGPIRIVTYNVHKGFATDGRLDLESLARAIEAERPDVVALQEVSRGQVAEGTADEAEWLSRRLGMPYVFTPTSAGVWGQAILTRFPIVRAEAGLLPPEDLPTARSYCLLELDAGWGEPLGFVTTHYTSAWGTAAREAHSAALASILARRGLRRLIVTGDFNARPDQTPMRPLLGLGLLDAGVAAGPTVPSTAPTARIDYVLHTPDLTPTRVNLFGGQASDHLGISVTLCLRASV